MQGKTINGFALQRLLGTGGMAEVWYAENEIGMKAAVKIMSEKLSHDEQMQERFLNEAKVMVRLDHPNIRKVYGYGSIDNRPAIIMEYLDGSDLKARMKRGQHFSQEELKRWWNQIVDALNYTHSQDIVHRDIKPSNIFVDQKGNAKLLDFGIAKVADTSSGTLTGSTLGTRIYMSPEQVKDPKRVGTASDLYSLAVSFVHLLTGKAPYDSTTSSDYDIQESIVRKPLDLSKVPTEWRSFLEPYLGKNPVDRPALRAYDAVPGVSQNADPDDYYYDDSTAADAPPLSTDEDTFAEISKSNAPQIKNGDESPSIPEKKVPSQATRRIKILLSILIPFFVFLLLVGGGVAAYFMWWHGKEKTEPKPKVVDNQTKDENNSNARWEEELDALKAERAEAEAAAKAKAEAEQKEDVAYKKCTTIAACDSYLKAYPQGRYVQEVRTKKAQLEAQAQQQSQQSLTGSANGHEWVDLGMPSGTLWATCNIGASKPEGYGNYYAWGETNTKSTYNWETYKYYNGGLTKYCSRSDHGYNDFTDNLSTLQSSDDPATTNWGSGWYVPSKIQWDELLNNTTNQWTMRNGVKGRLFTSKKNGQTIFLPAAASRWNSDLDNVGSYAHYWSSSLNPDSPSVAWNLLIRSDHCEVGAAVVRSSGFAVRPVREK